MTSWWQNTAIDYTMGISGMDLVMKDSNGGNGFTYLRPDFEKFFPTTVRITMVQVSAGATYDPSILCRRSTEGRPSPRRGPARRRADDASVDSGRRGWRGERRRRGRRGRAEHGLRRAGRRRHDRRGRTGGHARLDHGQRGCQSAATLSATTGGAGSNGNGAGGSGGPPRSSGEANANGCDCSVFGREAGSSPDSPRRWPWRSSRRGPVADAGLESPTEAQIQPGPRSAFRLSATAFSRQWWATSSRRRSSAKGLGSNGVRIAHEPVAGNALRQVIGIFCKARSRAMMSSSCQPFMSGIHQIEHDRRTDAMPGL